MSAATITRNGVHVDRMERTNSYHRAVLWSWAELAHISVQMEDDAEWPTHRLRWRVWSLSAPQTLICERGGVLTAAAMGRLWRGAGQGFAVEVLA